MKKRVLLVGVMLVVVISMMLIGCGDDKTDPEEIPYEKSVDAAQLAEYITENVTFVDYMEAMSEDIIYQMYDIDKEDVVNVAIYGSTGATAEEVAVITVKNKENAKDVFEAFNERVADQKASFENYVPGEMDKLEKATIKQIGDAVIMVIADNPDEVAVVIDSYLKEHPVPAGK